MLGRKLGRRPATEVDDGHLAALGHRRLRGPRRGDRDRPRVRVPGRERLGAGEHRECAPAVRGRERHDRHVGPVLDGMPVRPVVCLLEDRDDRHEPAGGGGRPDQPCVGLSADGRA